jgi:tetratricopeptide (TPR) repeat protein
MIWQQKILGGYFPFPERTQDFDEVLFKEHNVLVPHFSKRRLSSTDIKRLGQTVPYPSLSFFGPNVEEKYIDLRPPQALIKQGKYPKALYALEKIYNKNNGEMNTWFYTIQANALVKMGLRKKAVDVCDEAIVKGLFNAVTLNIKAKALDNMGRHKDAVNVCWEAVYKWKMFNAVTFNTMANALDNMDLPNEAVNVCWQAIYQWRIFNAVTFNTMAKTLDNMGRHKDAVTVCAAAIDNWKSFDMVTFLSKAKALSNLGRFREADSVYTYVQNNYDETWSLVVNMLESYLARRDFVKVEEICLKTGKYQCETIPLPNLRHMAFSEHFMRRLIKRNIDQNEMFASFDKFSKVIKCPDTSIAYTYLNGWLVKIRISIEEGVLVTIFNHIASHEKLRTKPLSTRLPLYQQLPPVFPPTRFR